ncbi:hypothetical protein SAMN05421823_104494 [Catalinimonas alkaloidigena]|uniref:Uncharacterized protein n=1 Tax=Catalinimonas alkaloidigena TaxID=1075417 RepID=A0A1G9HP77_9BACT|nr:hypothetical protein [Catalinimonas alkaloidigena]SDL14740.1 hypothetical protein SAMN05421823_104494 [Catalinimonas alkaloidigena]
MNASSTFQQWQSTYLPLSEHLLTDPSLVRAFTEGYQAHAPASANTIEQKRARFSHEPDQWLHWLEDRWKARHRELLDLERTLHMQWEVEHDQPLEPLFQQCGRAFAAWQQIDALLTEQIQTRLLQLVKRPGGTDLMARNPVQVWWPTQVSNALREEIERGTRRAQQLNSTWREQHPSPLSVDALFDLRQTLEMIQQRLSHLVAQRSLLDHLEETGYWLELNRQRIEWLEAAEAPIKIKADYHEALHYAFLAYHYLPEEASDAFAEVLRGGTFSQTLIFQGYANQLVDVFLRAHHQGWIVGTKAKLAQWLCHCFRVITPEGPQLLNRAYVEKVLSFQKRCTRPLPVEGLPLRIEK